MDGERPRAGYRLGADVGGTFTGLVACGPDGVLRSAKVPSLPGERVQGPSVYAS